MEKLIDWFLMGGYAIYIWSAYGIVCVVLVMQLLGIKWQRTNQQKKLKEWLKRK